MPSALTAADPPESALYLDSSALVKLVVREAETDALAAELNAWPGGVVTSAIAAVEVPRAAARARHEGRDNVHDDGVVLEILAGIDQIGISDEIVVAARQLEPVELRSLDALHLASALTLEGTTAAVVTYDSRMQDAAGRYGLGVLAPA